MNLRLDSVTYAYPAGATALQGVSLGITGGTWTALVGENGAGKSTLAKLLCGLLRPSTGEVWVGDWNTRDHSAAQLAQRVSYVFQNPDDQLFERSVESEVAFGPRNLGLSPAEVRDRVDGALQALQLQDLRSRHPYELTPSQRKFVALAAADAIQAPVLLLDEPTTGLDGPGMAHLAAFLDAKRQQGRTVMAISHDMDFVAEHFQQVIVMAEGRVVADEATADLFRQHTLLLEHQLESPQLVRLAQALGWDQVCLTPADFVDALAARQPGPRT